MKTGTPAYRINTGFCYFADIAIPSDKLIQLQGNLIVSYCVGPSFIIPSTKIILALRINALCKGFRGVSQNLINKLVETFNEGCYSYVPEQFQTLPLLLSLSQHHCFDEPSISVSLSTVESLVQLHFQHSYSLTLSTT